MSEIDIFDKCGCINDLLSQNKEDVAREELINLLNYHKQNNIGYSPLINHLIRLTGLYPYLDLETSLWEDQLVFSLFKVDTGVEKQTLHREQSDVLRLLLEEKDVVLSAPTSFGKSFIIDAFIAIKRPLNVIIIVPTISLTDETRRRLNKKFSNEYKIITSTDAQLGNKNIFVFPQERALNYLDKIERIDILIVDEFYKVSPKHESRAQVLQRAILEFGKKARQKYFLAPNITSVEDNPFTEGMIFINKLDFNTVFLKKYDCYKFIKNDEEKKKAYLYQILKNTPTRKTLIYASSYGQIEKIANYLNSDFEISNNNLVQCFSNWLETHYSQDWQLAKLIKRGIGIHNGQLHRSISQLQVEVFEDKFGLNTIISTSSLIEGVNTSAENVIIWRNRRSGGNSLLDPFTYKNIIGRGGRMFKYFVGNIYLLESPPQEVPVNLEIEFMEEAIDDIEDSPHIKEFTKQDIDKIIRNKYRLLDLLGESNYEKLILKKQITYLSKDEIISVIEDMRDNPSKWNGFSYLNSDNPASWKRILKNILWIKPNAWGNGRYGETIPKIISCVGAITKNWQCSIPQILSSLSKDDITIDDFFLLERKISYDLASITSDINLLYQAILDENIDVSSFVNKLSNAFLPPNVYTLEEYGLPRMISKKIHRNGIINLENTISIYDILEKFKLIGIDKILQIKTLDSFDKYIVNFFYSGIQ